MLKLEEEECLSVTWSRLCHISTNRPIPTKQFLETWMGILRKRGLKDFS